MLWRSVCGVIRLEPRLGHARAAVRHACGPDARVRRGSVVRPGSTGTAGCSRPSRRRSKPRAAWRCRGEAACSAPSCLCPGSGCERRAKRDVAASHIHQLGSSEPGLHREQQQGMVAPSRPGRAIRSRQQRRDLVSVEKRHRALHIALVGHGEDALAMQQPGRIGHRDIAEERADRGEPGVAASRAVTRARSRRGRGSRRQDRRRCPRSSA